MVCPHTPGFHEDFVDCKLSANLDSAFAFEGPEKLLDITFFDLARYECCRGLRSIGLEKWAQILDLVSCKILSRRSSDYMDAYLLSESSLFVFPNRIILKTCGTTTTLACLEELLKEVQKCLENVAIEGFTSPRVTYSRRNFLFPNKQKHVHCDWNKEVAYLNTYFGRGKSYVLGDLTRNDHWYLYVCGSPRTVCGSSQKLEILMADLNPQRAANFYTDRVLGKDSLIEDSQDEHDLGHDMGIEMMQNAGLDMVLRLPNQSSAHLPSPSLSDSMESVSSEGLKEEQKNRCHFVHDAFSFTPCGFSSNSIDISGGGHYYTLHVTPETDWSYASFETNIPFGKGAEIGVGEVLSNIVDIFRPGRFSATFQLNSKSFEENLKFERLSDVFVPNCYEKNEGINFELPNGCSLAYVNFTLKDE